MKNSEMIEIDGEILRETAAAIHFYDGSTEAWLPKSQIEWIEKLAGGKLVEIEIPEWLAFKKGLI